MFINSRTKGTFFVGIMLIILISGLVIYDSRLQESIAETTFEQIEEIIVQKEFQIYAKTQEKISALIGKDVFIPVTDRTFIHITFLALALAVILITQGVYTVLIQKEQAISLQEQTSSDEFINVSDFQKFHHAAEHLLKSRVNTDINYTMIKLDLENLSKINQHYGPDAGNRFFKNLSKLLYTFTNSDFDTFTRINPEQFLLLLHYKNIEEFEKSKAIFDHALAIALAEFSNSKVKVSEGSYDIPVNETDIVNIFEKVNIAHRLVKNN